MDMIAMLAGLGAPVAPTQAELEAQAAIAKAQQDAAAVASEGTKNFWKAVGLIAVGAAAGWVARGYSERV